MRIGRLPYLYFLLLFLSLSVAEHDWKTAVFILPFTPRAACFARYMIGRLPYLYFLLLSPLEESPRQRLEDCRIYTSFYYRPRKPQVFSIGRLPYLYFLLLLTDAIMVVEDWKTAVFILPFTLRPRPCQRAGLEDCRIYTSFYSEFRRTKADRDWKTAVFILPFTADCLTF